MDAQPEISHNDDTSSEVDNTETVLPNEQIDTTRILLQNMNEYCLREIFSNNSWTPLTMCSVAETCTRFKQIIQSSVLTKFEILVYGNVCIFKSTNFFKRFIDARDIERILKNFGPCLSKLKMYDNSPIVSNAVAKYCSGGTLERIDIHPVSHQNEIIELFTVKFKLIFQRLRALSFYDGYNYSPGNRTTIHLNCDSLTELKICHLNHRIAILIMENTFPQLERFTFFRNGSNVPDTLLKFIGRHKCLKTIDVAGYFSSGLLHAIGISCKELEEVTLSPSTKQLYRNLSDLECLTKLRMLDVACHLEINQIAIVALLKASESLEIVKLRFIREMKVEIVDALSQLQNLRELHLICCSLNRIRWEMLPQLTKLYLSNNNNGQLHEPDVLDIISHLVNLEELELIGWPAVCALIENVYYEIATIAEQKPFKVLTIKFNFNGEHFIQNLNHSPNVELIHSI